MKTIQKKFSTLLILSILTSICGIAQTTITGTVTGTKGESLPNANIYIEGTYEGVASNLDGVFEFETNLVGNHILNVEFVGYHKWSKSFDFNNERIELTIELKEAFNELKAAVISAGAFEASDEKKAVVLKPLDIVTTAGATGDIAGALQTLPGTTTVGESGRLFVRGGTSEETKTFINGTLVHAPYTTSPANLSVRGRFNPFMFSGTIFSTGGYSAEYGQALSSALVLNTYDIPKDEELNISLMTIGGDLAGTKKWENGAVTVNAGYVNLGPYMSLVPQNMSWNKFPQSGNAAINLVQKTKSNGTLKLYSSLSRSTMEIEDTNGFSDAQTSSVGIVNDNAFTNLSYKSTVGENSSLNAGGSFTINEDIFEQGEQTYSQELRGSHAKTVLKTSLHPQITLKNGVEWFYKDYATKFESIEEQDFSASFQENKIAAFSEGDFHLNNKIVLRAGIRGEYSDYLKREAISPRLSAAYKISEESQLSLAVGKFAQDPVDDYILYSDEFEYEEANHYILNYQITKEKRTLRAEVYFKDYQNLVKTSTSVDGFEANHEGHGYATGFDLFWRDQETIKGGDYWVSYSYIDTKRDYRDYPGLYTPSFASKHNFSVVYKHWVQRLRSQFGGTIQYSAPRSYNDLNTSEFNDAKMTPYRSLNANWSFLYKQNVIFYASATNILGFKNSFGREFAAEPDETGYYDSQEILPGADRFFFIGCFITLSDNKEKNQLNKIN